MTKKIKTKIEYRVRPVTRYMVTRYATSANGVGPSTTGLFDNEAHAILAAQALAKYEPGAVFDAAPAVSNKHAVGGEKWNDWHPQAQQTFNYLFEMMTKSVDLFLHPKAPRPSKEGARTTAWNAAWLAADQVHEAVTGEPAPN